MKFLEGINTMIGDNMIDLPRNPEVLARRERCEAAVDFAVSQTIARLPEREHAGFYRSLARTFGQLAGPDLDHVATVREVRG